MSEPVPPPRPFISRERRSEILAKLAAAAAEVTPAVTPEEIAALASEFGAQQTPGAVPHLKDGGKDDNAKDSKDAKDSKEHKESKDSLAKDTKDLKETKEHKETKETKEGKESKEGKEAKESKEGKETKEAKEAKDLQKETKEKEGKEDVEGSGWSDSDDTPPDSDSDSDSDSAGALEMPTEPTAPGETGSPKPTGHITQPPVV
jgi:hypothetical protein